MAKKRHAKKLRIPTTILIVLSALAVFFIVAAAKASAQPEDASYVRYVIRQQWVRHTDMFGSVTYQRRYVRVARPAYRPRVYGYERRDDEYEHHGDRRPDHAMCLGTVVDVLSTEHQQEENAREAARKLWMAKTQWAHGGQYMALENATGVRWRCSASNAHDTISGKLAESVGKLTGRDGQNVRCALWATPCKAQREKDRDLRR